MNLVDIICYLVFLVFTLGFVVGSTLMDATSTSIMINTTYEESIVLAAILGIFLFFVCFFIYLLAIER